jgi:transposase
LSRTAPFTISRIRRSHRTSAARATLYIAAVSAVRHNPPLIAFYRRLRGRGEPAKVALTAVMRKLLTILNAMLKHHIV